MFRWPRRNALPADLRNRLALKRGERVIAHASTRDQAVVVATTTALYLPDESAVPWERVEHARWSEDGLTLTVEGEAERVIAIPEPGPLAEVMFERVTATIVVSEHVPLFSPEEGSPGVRLIARRAPGSTDVVWQIRYDEAVDSDSADVRARADLALSRLREQVGL